MNRSRYGGKRTFADEGTQVELATARALLARVHEAQNEFYAGGEAAGLRALLTDDVHWHVPGDNVVAGDYTGIDAVLGYFATRRDIAARTFRVGPTDVLTGEGDQIAAVSEGSAVLGGTLRTWSTVGVYQVRDERIAACWLVPFDAALFDALWSGPAGITVYRTRVRPRHCDAQGRLHASRYEEYFEDALLAWLDQQLGGYARLRTDGVDLVVAARGCEHLLSPALDDPVAVEVRLTKAGETSVRFGFTVRVGEQVHANAEVSYVCVADGRPVKVPDSLRALVS